jgi:hypothetical protein
MDGVVQQPGETIMDSARGYNWADLAASLPGYHTDIRVCVRAGDS